MNWREIKGYEGLYRVSDTGIVEGVDRITINSKGVARPVKGKVLAVRQNTRGYLSVKLCKEGRQKTFVVHRLVAAAFKENINDLPQVNHLDGNKLNNAANNLEWATPSSNAKHAYEIGLNTQCGCTHHLAVAVIDVKTGEIYCTQKALADALGVNYPMLKNALNGYRPFPKGVDLENHDYRKYRQGDC